MSLGQRGGIEDEISTCLVFRVNEGEDFKIFSLRLFKIVTAVVLGREIVVSFVA